jgi:hypothetical protein
VDGDSLPPQAASASAPDIQTRPIDKRMRMVSSLNQKPAVCGLV